MKGEEAMLAKSTPETVLEYEVDITAVVEHGGEAEKHLFQSFLLPVFRFERLAETHHSHQQQNADAEQNPENAAPADDVGKESAQHGSRYRCHTVDGADDGHRFGKFFPGKHVGSHRTRDDDAAGTGDALEQAQGDERFNVRRVDAEQGGNDEYQHRGQKKRTAAELVAQRTENELSYGEANHAGGESQLHH